MHTRFYSFIVGILFCLHVISAPVDKNTARDIAECFILNKLGTVGLTDANMPYEAKRRFAVSDNGAPAFHVFNVGNNDGYVIVSGDDSFPEIIGYSTDGAFDENMSMPDGLICFLESYSEYVSDVRQGLAEPPVMELSEGSSAVAPLCAAEWGQGTPFDDFIPKDNGAVCPVGCVATSMAQIMYKWKFPERPKPLKVSYNTQNWNIGVIVEDFSTDEHIYEWELMKPKANGNVISSSRKAVSRLSYDCGVATKMQYTSAGSGAYDEDALIAYYRYFSYDASSLELVFRECVDSEEEWTNIIKRELDEGRPVHFSASSPEGEGRDAAGHAFVIDGYDNNGLVHVNWGWYGSYNGYYQLSVLDVGAYRFSDLQTVIIGIEPGTGEEKPKQYRLYAENAPAVYEDVVNRGDLFNVNLDGVYNISLYPHEWSYGIGLFDKKGDFVCNVDVRKGNNKVELNGGYGFEDDVVCALPDDCADGDYMLRLVCKEKGYEDWVLPNCMGGDKLNSIPLWVTENELRFNQVSSSLSDVFAEGQKTASSECFDMVGRKILSPVRGAPYVERFVREDGTSFSIKKIKR